MSILFDSGTHKTAETGTSLTYAHTCSGSDRALLVGVSIDGTASDVVTGVTYNGVAMTRVPNSFVGDGTNTNSSVMYSLAAPATGSHNVVASISGGAMSIRSACASYTGVNQGLTINSSTAELNTAATSITLDTTTSAGNAWVVAYIQGGDVITAGSGTTIRGGASSAHQIADKNGTTTPPGAASIVFTQNSSQRSVGSVLSLAPAMTLANIYSASFLAASSQYAKVSNDLGITSGNVTIECWFKPRASTNDQTLVYKGDAGTNINYSLMYRNQGGGFEVQAFRNKGGISTAQSVWAVTLSTSAWYHLVLTYDGSNVQLHYATVGGTHTSATAAASTGNGTSGNLDATVVGMNLEDGLGNERWYCDGSVDEVRVWNTVRTTGQMNASFETELAGNETGLVGYWRFDGDWTDSQTNIAVNNLTPVNTPTFVGIIPFKTTPVTNSSSGSFDRVTAQWAEVKSNLGITTNNATMTIECWARLNTQVDGGSNQRLAMFSQGNNTTKIDFFLELADNGGSPILRASRDRNGIGGENVNWSYTATLNTWVHYVLWTDGSTMKTYTASVGGTHTERGSTAIANSNGTNFVADHFNISDDRYPGTTNGLYFPGQIDEVRVWNTARTVAQLDALFETQLVGNEPGLVAYYKMNSNWTDSQASGLYSMDNFSASLPPFSASVPFTGSASNSIKFDNSKIAGQAGGTLTYSFTCGSDANRVMVACTEGSISNDSISGVSFNGVAFTKLYATQVPSNNRYVTSWYLVNPASGAHDVVTTNSDGGSDDTLCSVSSYSGVAQLATPAASTTATATALSDFVLTLNSHSLTLTYQGSSIFRSGGTILQLNPVTGHEAYVGCVMIQASPFAGVGANTFARTGPINGSFIVDDVIYAHFGVIGPFPTHFND